TGRKEEAYSKLPKFQGTFVNLEQELDKLGNTIEEDVKDSVKMGRQAATTARQISGIVIVATLFFGILLSLFISRIIT
ncbi:hypothetical protein PCJ37_28510, partial [Klebsiella pneumoniae]|uniref:hypothetical protein n=1 Tax=Klebsiella pneumoniae TaxID=573 RepID=UPI0023AEB48C